jgi:hypothetical protein
MRDRERATVSGLESRGQDERAGRIGVDGRRGGGRGGKERRERTRPV